MPWSLDDLDFATIDVARMRGREDLCMLVCSASFVESTSATYAHNLVERFADDAELCAWLIEHWTPEELQHGLALKTYVRAVWPGFDWDAAYASFLAEYAQLCTCAALEPTKARELVARCMVEMGTTTFYQALGALCDDAVLRDLCGRIRADEVRHYKVFLRHFRRYQRLEHLHRPQMLAALWRRIAELRRSDVEIALHHVVAGSNGAQAPSFETIKRHTFRLIQGRYPMRLAVRMAIKPLRLHPRLQRWAEAPLTALARKFLLRA